MKIVLLETIGASETALKDFEDKLKSLGHEFILFDNRPFSEEEIVKRISEAELVILSNLPINSNVINNCKNLKLISIAFTGFDHVDTDVCKEKGIVVCNAAGYSTNSVAELAFGLMISLFRKILVCDGVTRKQGTRKGLIGNELKGKTLGIIGTGTIGLRVAEIGKVFGCNLLGYSRSERKKAITLGLKYVDLKTLLRTSDIVTIHTPLNKDTKDILNKDEFEIMKQSAILIQTSRGGTVNEEALAEALNSGKIAGAGIDVFVQEPPVDIDNPLLKTNNTVITPHVAFATKEALDARADIVFNNILKYFDDDIQNRVA